MVTEDTTSEPSLSEDSYLLGTDPEEVKRLDAQHRLWADATQDLWNRAGFGLGWRLLDLGCGPGFASVDLARLVGVHGQVLAIDKSCRFVELLARERIRLQLNQLTERVARAQTLELEPDSLDGVFTRWFFCFLEDPEAVIAQVTSGLRLGGRFVVQDYLNYTATTLQPRGASFDSVIVAIQKSWRRTGASLDVGGRLPGMLTAQGFHVLELFPMVRFARPGSDFWRWAKRFFFGYLPRLVEEGLLTVIEREAFEAEWLERERSSGGFLCTPPMVGIVAEKV